MPPSQIEAIVRDLLESLQELHGEGLFHNDVRSWNVLWDGEKARLIDFADASRIDFDGDLASVLWLVARAVDGHPGTDRPGQVRPSPAGGDRSALPRALRPGGGRYAPGDPAGALTGACA